EDPDVRVEWVGWEGRPPGHPFAGYSEEEKREKYEKAHKPLADKYGVPIRVAGADYRTTNAHIATYYARAMGRFKEFRDRVYRARWVEDLDLESPDVLARLGEEVGLDGDGVQRVIAEKRYLAVLHSQRAQGKGLGIRGIPSFVVQGKIFWSVDPIDDVKAAVARVKEERLRQEAQDG
ncbi:MAG: DsbA family protein, partial [Nitrospinota bacterium]